MSYSQRKEEEIIVRFFQSPAGNLKVLNLLSIGENDGKTLSNVRALMEAGWWGWLVEPDPLAYNKLHKLYEASDRAKLFNLAIGVRTKEETFYSSGTHLGLGDTGLLSTLDPVEMEKWKAAGTPFTETKVTVMSWEDFYKGENFDLISIDAEGFDLKILKQIDFNVTKTKMVVVEWNGKNRHLYDAIMYKFQFNLINIDFENLIYAR